VLTFDFRDSVSRDKMTQVAMRACKTDTSFTAMIQITASVIAMR